MLLLHGGDSILSRSSHNYGVSTLLEQTGSQQLVYRVVLGYQDSQSTPILYQRMLGDERGPLLLSIYQIQHDFDGVQKIGSFDGFVQIRADSQIAASRCVTARPGRSHHDNEGVQEVGVFLDGLRDRKAVHTRHLSVQENQREWCSLFFSRGQ